MGTDKKNADIGSSKTKLAQPWRLVSGFCVFR